MATPELAAIGQAKQREASATADMWRPPLHCPSAVGAICLLSMIALPARLLMPLAVFLALASPARADGGPSEWRTGDADCSGRIDAIDAAAMLQWNAGLVLALPCWRAADANNDLAVDSLDALLVLQQEAALIDRLGVAEVLLCPAPGGKGRYGNIDEEIDLTGDGTPEVVSIHLVPELSEAALGVSVYSDSGFQTIAETVVPTLFSGDPNGPDTWWAHTDLTGDGNDEAVLCVTTFGANDPLTSAVVYSFHGETLSSQPELVLLPHAFLSSEGGGLVVSSRLDWYASDCEAIITTYYEWDGTQLAPAREDVTKRFRRPDCEDLWPPASSTDAGTDKRMAVRKLAGW